MDIDLSSWDERANNWDKFENVCKIAMVGKYTGLSDSYISVLKSLQHACLATSHKLEVIWIEASVRATCSLFWIARRRAVARKDASIIFVSAHRHVLWNADCAGGARIDIVHGFRVRMLIQQLECYHA